MFKEKYKAMFLSNVKIDYRLLALVVFVLVLLTAIGSLGIIGMKRTVAATDKVYTDNVVPLNELKARAGEQGIAETSLIAREM